MLSEKQYMAIKYILRGDEKKDISEKIGVSRATVYNWLNNKEFMDELDTLRLDIQTSTKEQISNKIKFYVNEIEEMALNKKTPSKVRADLLKYLVNRVWGNTTTKNEVTIEKKKEVEFDIDNFIEKIKNQESELENQ